jgi:hypothetical protein
VNLRKSPSDLFISVTGNNPRYKKIDAISSGQTLDLDFNYDFLAFDHVYPVAFESPNFLGSIRGFATALEAAENTNTNYHELCSFGGSTDQLKMGFNDGYPFYITNWSAILSPNGVRVGYYKLGDAPVPGSFMLFNSDFQINNEDFTKFHFTVGAAFNYCYNEWISVDEFSLNTPIINWQIARPVTSQKPALTKIPDELVEAYPYIESVFGRLGYKSSTFVMNIQGTTYENYLKDQWGTDSFGLKPREWFSVSR